MPLDDQGIASNAVTGGCVAIGNFDGVHRGHQSMIGVLRRKADALAVPAIAMTFDPPPVELLRPEAAPPRLMRLEEKTSYLKEAGADEVIVLATTPELLELSAKDFFSVVLQERLRVRGLVEGPNFRFGQNRQGDIALLDALCHQSGISLSIVDPVSIDGTMISSTVIRTSVQAGELPMAAHLLGRPHQVVGIVEHGANRGSVIGFPTANLSAVTTLLPPDGVYAGRTTIDGRPYAVAIHIGPNHTFGETIRQVEAHLLDFSGDLYDNTLQLDLIDKVRNSTRFESPDALISQMRQDCEHVRTVVAPLLQGG